MAIVMGKLKNKENILLPIIWGRDAPRIFFKGFTTASKTTQHFGNRCSALIELKRYASRWTKTRRKISPIEWRKMNTSDTKRIGGSLSINLENWTDERSISSKGFDSSICDWKNKFSLFGKYHLFRIESFRVDFWCVHRFQLLKVCDQYVTLPNSPRVQSVSEEQSRQDFLSKLMDSWLVLRSHKVILNQWTKWNNRSFKWLPKTSFIGRLPFRY